MRTRLITVAVIAIVVGIVGVFFYVVWV